MLVKGSKFFLAAVALTAVALAGVAAGGAVVPEASDMVPKRVHRFGKVQANGPRVQRQGGTAHTAGHAYVVNGKVSHMTARHNTQGNVPVKKFITRKGKQKFSTATEDPNREHFVSFVAEDADAGESLAQGGGITCYVGWQFYCQTTRVVVIYWFPVYQVQSTSGCTPYPNNDGPFGGNTDDSGGDGGYGGDGY